jgi:N-acetylglutamate synthase-like GNAT family acetyltransferase
MLHMIRIQPFLPEYTAGVIAVILPIQQTEFGIPVTLDAQPDLLDIPGFYQHGCGNFWVALEGEKVVGCIAALDIGDHQVALRKMFVAAPYRGAANGVARALMQTLIDACGRQGIREVFLGTTEKFLAAHRFYEKNAFQSIPREALPPAFPVMAVDSRFYRRELRV